MHTKKDSIIGIITGIVTIAISIPAYFVIKSIVCRGCSEIRCAFCDLGSVILAFLLFVFSVALTIVSTAKLHNYQKRKHLTLSR